MISKVLEKIIFTQLSSYCNEAKLFFDNQYGFRPKHCAEYAALELVDRIINQGTADHPTGCPGQNILEIKKSGR